MQKKFVCLHYSYIFYIQLFNYYYYLGFDPDKKLFNLLLVWYQNISRERVGGVMVSVLECGRSWVQTKDYKIGRCCFQTLKMN